MDFQQLKTFHFGNPCPFSFRFLGEASNIFTAQLYHCVEVRAPNPTRLLPFLFLFSAQGSFFPGAPYAPLIHRLASFFYFVFHSIISVLYHFCMCVHCGQVIHKILQTTFIKIKVITCKYKFLSFFGKFSYPTFFYFWKFIICKYKFLV